MDQTLIGPRFSPDAFVDALASTWVAVPLSAREPLNVFRRPSGASHTMASLFGSFFLDMAALGRHLRIHIEPATLEASLSAVFGDQGPALATRLSERSAKIEEQLRERADDVNTFVAQVGEQRSSETADPGGPALDHAPGEGAAGRGGPLGRSLGGGA